MAGHISSTKIYYAVFAALIVGTALTTGAAFIDLGRWNVVIALIIAITKATLVALFFMHVKYSSPLVRLTVVAGLFWLAILISLSMGDYLTRSWIPSPPEWQSSAPQNLP
jgi:cytochrome c oxidase subunit 4